MQGTLSGMMACPVLLAGLLPLFFLLHGLPCFVTAIERAKEIMLTEDVSYS